MFVSFICLLILVFLIVFVLCFVVSAIQFCTDLVRFPELRKELKETIKRIKEQNNIIDVPDESEEDKNEN